MMMGWTPAVVALAAVPIILIARPKTPSQGAEKHPPALQSVSREGDCQSQRLSSVIIPCLSTQTSTGPQVVRLVTFGLFGVRPDHDKPRTHRSPDHLGIALAEMDGPLAEHGVPRRDDDLQGIARAP